MLQKSDGCLLGDMMWCV